MLYRKWVLDESPENSILQFVVPSRMRDEILFQLHNHKTSGHLGVRKTLGKLNKDFIGLDINGTLVVGAKRVGHVTATNQVTCRRKLH